MSELSHQDVIRAFAGDSDHAGFSAQFQDAVNRVCESRDEAATHLQQDEPVGLPKWQTERTRPFQRMRVWQPNAELTVPRQGLSTIRLSVPNGEEVRKIELHLYNAGSDKLALEVHEFDKTIHATHRDSTPVRKAPQAALYYEVKDVVALDEVLKKSLGMLAWMASPRFPGGTPYAQES